MRKQALLFLFYSCMLNLAIFNSGFSQSQSDTTKKNVHLLPIPVLYYTPETRFAFGAALTATWHFKKDSIESKSSQASAGVAYTQNKQWLFYLPFKIFYDQNHYYFFGELGYYRYDYYYFGIGNNGIPKELYHVNFPRMRINAVREIAPHLYAGLRYQYENYQITRRKPGGSLAADTIPGNTGSITSGAGVVLLYDSRNRVNDPTKGWFGKVSYTHNGAYLGGNFRFSRWIADVSSYYSLNKHLIWATNYYVSFISGHTPFSQLSMLGGGKKMRGYYEGRFRDKNLLLLQTEFRQQVYKRWGLVAFGAVGALGNQHPFIRFNDPKIAVGIGIRFDAIRSEHLNLRLDYAIGKNSDGLYFTVGEAF